MWRSGKYERERERDSYGRTTGLLDYKITRWVFLHLCNNCSLPILDRGQIEETSERILIFLAFKFLYDVFGCIYYTDATNINWNVYIGTQYLYFCPTNI